VRDRDQQGRPRNARPRDALGRPLPRGAQPDQDAPVIPDRIDPADAARLADELLRNGRPFHAHEALEAAWKSGPAAERDLWQGLAQIAVGITHARRGNAHGAVMLLRRGARRAGRHDGGYGIDLAGYCRAANELADRIETAGLDAIKPETLRRGLLR
jgi:uncharacterized protein